MRIGPLEIAWRHDSRPIVIVHARLTEADMAAAFRVPETDLRFRAVLQMAGDLEREANEQAQKMVANPQILASLVGGAEHIGILRDRLIAARVEAVNAREAKR